MINVFSQYSIPQLSAVARRTALTAAGLAVAALVGGILASRPLFGVGFCAGVALALANFRLVTRATAKAAADATSHPKRQLAGNTLLRLGAISVIALGMAVANLTLGLGALIALAVFQFGLLANLLIAMLRNPMMGDTSMGQPLADEEDDE